MVRDTAYDLESRLRRIDEKMTQMNIEDANIPEVTVDLEDEKEVTRQCLRVCEDAKSHIESLLERESSLLPETVTAETKLFDAQLRARQALSDNRDGVIATISHLQRRLDILVRNDGPAKDEERSQLQADIDVSKQCLDVCQMANELSRQTIFRIGEVIAEGDSDQVVVTTLADLFDIKKALSRDHSAQLVGSTTPESLHFLTEKRYESRFGAVVGHPKSSETDAPNPPVGFVVQKPADAANVSETDDQEQPLTPKTLRPTPNEMRKRHMERAYEKREKHGR
jgi:Fungal N-terminal domain of STAND proteins